MSIADRALKLRTYPEFRDADRLIRWRFGVPRLRQAFGLFTGPDPILELHARGPNKTGKTLTKAAFVLGCLQKRSELDGCQLPQWPGRVEAINLVLDYPQQLLSVKPAYLKLLGNWPARIRNNGDYLDSIHVDHVDGAMEKDWSVIYFRTQKNPDTARGARADIVDFDEPPSMFFLQELRKAAHAGRLGIIIIGETPEKRIEWGPIKEDYGDCPRRSIKRVDQDRAEVRWSLDEVESWVLSDEEKARLRRAYKNDPIKDAREHGDYVNAAGTSPWGELRTAALIEMLAKVKEPKPTKCRVMQEAIGGKPATTSEVMVKVFTPPAGVKKAYIDVDPASGAENNRHEAALHVSEWGTGNLLATWAGYLSPFSLGILAAGLSRQYHEADIDIEMKDHWGVNVVRGVTAGRMAHRLCYEQRELSPGNWAKETGFDQNEETKSIIIGCIQDWLDAWNAGIPYAACPSSEVLETLLDAQLDDRGKIIAGEGLAHGHHMILWGQKLRRIVTRSNKLVPDLQKPELTHDQWLIKKIFAPPEESDYEEPTWVPKSRP